ncbi:hypothetical protein [Mucilaginibacter ginkgonis]|uniref:DUF5640 domain-containing protein n=1 Tax=Mucilaginibacter ginkgonis TaxID=2682091 RepID=A0A6I4HVC8_9SPHI|nr:hypothetical protein [Mucilaginibacter ginkgonis]QQL49842.1 hypothetical protein GO620_017010 [Mucilaginibacter ginkgonis]
MKNFALIAIHVLCGTVLMFAACTGSTQSKLKGNWHSKDGSIKLKITNKQVITNNDTSAAEEYILKEDTILTSFEGNRPYTKLVIQKLDGDDMQLLYPDSVSIEFSK